MHIIYTPPRPTPTPTPTPPPTPTPTHALRPQPTHYDPNPRTTTFTGEPGDPEHRDTHADERAADDARDGGAVEEDGGDRDQQGQ